MKLKINDRVRVFSSSSSKLSKDQPSRPAVVKDLKYNLVYVRFEDGETECEWIDCRMLKPEEKPH